MFNHDIKPAITQVGFHCTFALLFLKRHRPGLTSLPAPHVVFFGVGYRFGWREKIANMLFTLIWMFLKMGVPRNHPFYITGISTIKQPFRGSLTGYLHLWNPPYLLWYRVEHPAVVVQIHRLVPRGFLLARSPGWGRGSGASSHGFMDFFMGILWDLP